MNYDTPSASYYDPPEPRQLCLNCERIITEDEPLFTLKFNTYCAPCAIALELENAVES